MMQSAQYKVGDVLTYFYGDFGCDYERVVITAVHPNEITAWSDFLNRNISINLDTKEHRIFPNGGRMVTDKELLELAAKACDGHPLTMNSGNPYRPWNPLEDSGDALRLAVKLQIIIGNYDSYASACVIGNPDVDEITVWYHKEPDQFKATRRAIVMTAAEIGRSMK